MNQMPELLIVAFGGPTPGCCHRFSRCPGEAYCFVSGIFGHHAARQERVAAVASHYAEFGGFSDFNAHTEQQARALATELEQRGTPLRIRCGFHHWRPYVRDVIADMQADGIREILVLVMAPHQSSVSWDLYLRIVGEGIELAGENAPQVIGVIDPWWHEAGFIEAIAARLTTAARTANIALAAPQTALLLTAHAVPEPVSRTAPYCRQVAETAALVAARLGVADYTVAYQSQPDDSAIPWTRPFLEEALASLAQAGKTAVVSAAIGFLCDNVEVLYDLGIAGKKRAAELGLTFVRAESVHDHPAFIQMLADHVQDRLQALR